MKWTTRTRKSLISGNRTRAPQMLDSGRVQKFAMNRFVRRVRHQWIAARCFLGMLGVLLPCTLLGILLFETSLTSLAQVGSGWAYFSAALVSGFVPPVSLSLCRSCGLELRTGANLAASSHLAVSHRRESQAQQAAALGKVRFLQKPLSCRCASGSGQTGASSQGRRS